VEVERMHVKSLAQEHRSGRSQLVCSE
jgi:hypothetical protein